LDLILNNGNEQSRAYPCGAAELQKYPKSVFPIDVQLP